jgi:excisionase family DNA binding protein
VPSGGSNKLLSLKDLADMFSVSVDTVYRNYSEWGLVAYRIGNQLRFKEREVVAWLERQAA